MPLTRYIEEYTKTHLEDIDEILISYFIYLQISDPNSTTPERLEFKISDIFFEFADPEKFARAILNLKTKVSSSINREVTSAMNSLYGANFEIESKETTLADFYNQHMDSRFEYLKNDSLGFMAVIDDYSINTEGLIHRYNILLNPSVFRAHLSTNIVNRIFIHDDFYKQLRGKYQLTNPRIQISKQLEFLKAYLDKRFSVTGETELSFKLSEVNFRHVIAIADTGIGKSFAFPSPLTPERIQKVLLPIYMELNGLIDIQSIKICTHPTETNDIDFIFSIKRPCITNRFFSHARGLSSETRQSLNENQIRVYERIFDSLQSNFLLNGNQEITADLADFLVWIIRKLSYTLEEPSYIKNKAISWLAANGSEKYQAMEDSFFLPFIHEKLVDAFNKKVAKKPERFGGEVDLTVLNLPVELKVRKKSKEPLVETIVDEKYAATSQAATYASITRLGFVFTLDLPEETNHVTNLDNCIKLIEKSFDSDNPFKTLIVVAIFYTNSPKPSVARST